MTLEFPSAALKGTQGLLADEVSGSNTDNEASCLARKCGTCRSENPVWAS
jgi:ferredoxin